MEINMKKVQCQDCLVGEVAEMLRSGDCSFSDESRIRLAQWLEELAKSREGIYQAQIALASTKSLRTYPDNNISYRNMSYTTSDDW